MDGRQDDLSGKFRFERTELPRLAEDADEFREPPDALAFLRDPLGKDPKLVGKLQPCPMRAMRNRFGLSRTMRE